MKATKKGNVARRAVQLMSNAYLLAVLCGDYAGWETNPTAAQAPSTPPAAQTPNPNAPAAPDQEMQGEHGGRMRGGMKKFTDACKGDINKFFPNVKLGGGRILQCLEEHSKEVSPNCAQFLEKREQRRQR